MDAIERNGGSNGNFSVDWTMAGSLSGAIGLLDASLNDRIYYTVQDQVGDTPKYTAFTAECTADVTMTAGWRRR